MQHVFPRCARLGWLPKFTHRISRFRHALPTRQSVARPHSPAPILNDAAAKRPQWSRVIQTIIRMRWLLKRGRAEDAVEKFQSCVSMIPLDAESRLFRFALFERGIATFLEYRRFESAVALYRQMFAERLYASNGLRARMSVCSSIIDTPNEPQENLQSLFNKLSGILSLPTYSQRSLRELLDIMKYHPLVDSQFVSKLVDQHTGSRGSIYELELRTLNKLVSFYAHAGSLGAAESLVVSPSSRPQPPVLYTTLMSSLAERGSLSSRHFNTLLDKMKQSQIPVDLPFFNVLIQWAVRNGNFHQAFALYETILQDKASHMIPDSFTFGSLFNAHQRLLTIRGPNLRRARQPLNAPTPRQLFRQMLECRVLAGQAADPRLQPVVRVSTLNVALRLFMLSMDYPAAFVTLRTFHALGLKPDARSYRFVLTILFAHIRRALLKAEADQEQHTWSHASWAVNFLGGSGSAAQVVGGGGGAEPEDAHMPLEVAYALLEFARGSNTGYRTPTVPVMLGDEEPPGKAEWDVEPLERLVAKAILASLVSRGVGREEAEGALRAKLAPYFYEMVPEKLSIGRRLRRARH